jgi:protein-S-isoprenylcysteine O-methyltransferase Ste14
MKIRSCVLPRIGQTIFRFRLFIGLAVALIALEWLRPTPFFTAPYRAVQTLALLVVALGVTLRGWAAGTAGPHTRSKHIEAHSLTTGGPFAFVRNPIYLGTICLGLGMCLLIGDPSAYLFSAVAFSILYIAIIPSEENFLRRRFGSDYRAYCEAVPRLLPRLRPWESSSKPTFQWRATLGELWIILIIFTIYALLLFEEHLDRLGLS